MLLYVPWFFDPAEPLFASPMRLKSVAFGLAEGLGTPNASFSVLISPAHAHRYRRFAYPPAGTDARLAAKVARYTFLSAELAPAVHARVSLAHPDIADVPFAHTDLLHFEF